MRQPGKSGYQACNLSLCWSSGDRFRCFLRRQKYIQNYGNWPNFLKTCYRRGKRGSADHISHGLPSQQHLIIGSIHRYRVPHFPAKLTRCALWIKSELRSFERLCHEICGKNESKLFVFIRKVLQAKAVCMGTEESNDLNCFE